jgi:hypothetical protein
VGSNPTPSAILAVRTGENVMLDVGEVIDRDEDDTPYIRPPKRHVDETIQKLEENLGQPIEAENVQQQVNKTFDQIVQNLDKE